MAIRETKERVADLEKYEEDEEGPIVATKSRRCRQVEGFVLRRGGVQVASTAFSFYA
jgi:hypothetical protein